MTCGTMMMTPTVGAAGGMCFTPGPYIEPPPCPFGLSNGPGVLALAPNSSWVAGYRTNCAEADPEALIWSPSTGFTYLPIPAPYEVSQAMDVNDAGTAVGWLAPVNPQTHKGFIYIQSILIPILPPPPLNRLDLFAINNSNVAVGSQEKTTNPNPIETHAIRWVAGVIEPLELPLPGHSVANDISDSGSIAGFMAHGTASLVGRGFIWTEDGVTTLEPLPGWSNSEARSLNNLGDAVGHCRKLPFDPKLGYLPRRATLWIDGEPIDLGILPGGWLSSVATDINDARQVIGYCSDNPGAFNRYFLWQDGVMYDLGQYVQLPDEIVTFGGAMAINNLGQILSGGVHIDGDIAGTGFILDPAPPADLSGDCAVNGLDLAALLADWGACRGKKSCAADLDGNGVVNGFDLAMLLAAWG
jgi:probable HAF family extracellular repeat protein